MLAEAGKTGLLHITVNEQSLSELRNDAPADIINDYYGSQSVITVTPGGLLQMASQLASRHLFCAGSRHKKRHQPTGAVTYLPSNTGPVQYASTCVPHFDFVELSDDTVRTRGFKYKLTPHHCHCDLRKFNLTNRVIPIWNSLPNQVVSAETVNTFKNSPDKLWSEQYVLHAYNADRHGIGNCSITL